MSSKSYRILHIPSGSCLRLFLLREKKQRRQSILNHYVELPIKEVSDSYDFLLYSVISDFTDDDESYWKKYKECNTFATKAIAKSILRHFFVFLDETTWSDKIILRRDIMLEEFEIIEV